MSKRVMIICEDEHGKEFFKKLIARLKEEGKITKLDHYNQDRFGGACNPKIERQLPIYREFRNYEDFIIVSDSEGKNIDDHKGRITCHIPEEYKDNTKIVIMDYEIEEWICKSEDIFYNGKPSDKLKQIRRYKKYQLPDYAEKIDICKLFDGCRSFNCFMNSLPEIQ